MHRGPLRAALPSLRDLPSETRSVSAAHSVNECCLVDDEEAVVELVGGLDRERVGVLRVELRHIDGMKQLVPRILHREHRYSLPFLCDERQNAVGEVRVDDDQFRLRHAHKFLHLLERVVDLPVVEHFLRRKLLVLHRIKYQLEALLVAGLVCVIPHLVGNLPPVCFLDAGVHYTYGSNRYYGQSVRPVQGFTELPCRAAD